MTIKVRATRRGFFGQERQVDDEFTIESKEQMGSWMELVGNQAVAEKSGGKAPADPFLDRSADLIKVDLVGLQVEQLAAYRELELAGKGRKGLIEAIDQTVAEKSANA